MVDANAPSIQNSKFLQHHSQPTCHPTLFKKKKNLGSARSPHLIRNRSILLPGLFSSFYLLFSCLNLSHPSRTSPRAIAMSINLTMAPSLPPRIHNSPHTSHRPRSIPPFSRRREPTYDRRRFTASPFLFLFLFNSCLSQSDFFPHMPSPDVGLSSLLAPVHSLESLTQPTPTLFYFLGYHRLLQPPKSWAHTLLSPHSFVLGLHLSTTYSPVLCFRFLFSLFHTLFVNFQSFYFIIKRLSPLYTPISFLLSPTFYFISKRLSPLDTPFTSSLSISFSVRRFTFYIQEAFSSLYPPFLHSFFNFFSIRLLSFIFKRLSPLYTPLFFYPFNFFWCPSFHILYSRGFLLSIPPFFSTLSTSSGVRLFTFYIQEAFSSLYPPFFSTPSTSFIVRLFTFYIQEAFSSLYPPFFQYLVSTSSNSLLFLPSPTLSAFINSKPYLFHYCAAYPTYQPISFGYIHTPLHYAPYITSRSLHYTPYHNSNLHSLLLFTGTRIQI
jgi:hypothetical protein